jgi:hypothetical protein
MDGNGKVDLRDRVCEDGNRINRSTGSCPSLSLCISGVQSLGTVASYFLLDRLRNAVPPLAWCTTFGNAAPTAQCGSKNGTTLGAFAKLLKATNYSVMSTCPHGTTRLPLDAFSWNFTWRFFENLSSKCKYNQNLTRITATLHEDLSTFVIILRWILLRMRNVSEECCRKNQNIHFIFKNLFFSDNREKIW